MLVFTPIKVEIFIHMKKFSMGTVPFIMNFTEYKGAKIKAFTSIVELKCFISNLQKIEKDLTTG